MGAHPFSVGTGVSARICESASWCAWGEKRSAILIAEGQKESAILKADAIRETKIREAQGQHIPEHRFHIVGPHALPPGNSRVRL